MPKTLQPFRRVTIDTGILVDHKFGRIDLADVADKLELDIAYVTVSNRELKGKAAKIVKLGHINEPLVWDESEWGDSDWSGAIAEIAIAGESVLGACVLGGDESANTLETILRVISNGSFPKEGQRENLSDGQANQLRDAMIFEAHVRNKRDLFVTNDLSAFGRDPTDKKRVKLESTFATKIMSGEEFRRSVEEALFNPDARAE